ncbi:MAG: hypothetical protein ACOC12_10035 [Bacteroidota bacterium]
MEIKRKIKKLLLIIILPGVLWLYFSQGAFRHYHVLNNGIKIEHSHPFKKNTIPCVPGQSHQHTDLEYSVLSQLGIEFTFLACMLLLGFIPFVTQQPWIMAHISHAAHAVYLFNKNLRAPPMSS